ncbi:MAG: FAD-dependent oxidoreductase [Deltaproteobacteria bacterium]|nr:FAD-dependent oxidoreductase [Deltaproteobacteria bacterium]
MAAGDNMDKEFDMIAVGSGVTGLSAALTAAEGGAKVIIFEKQPSLGGTSNFFEGTFAVESDIQRKQYITYSRDEAFRAIMEYSHWRANARLIRAFVNESASTINWLQQNGVEFIDAIINMPDAPRTYHTIRGSGAAVVKALATKAKENGVIIKLETEVKRIIKEGNRISGVIVDENGEDLEVKARTVVIGTGGYANNREWIKKYTGYDLDVNMLAFGNVGKMGDGIRMAWEVGAEEEGIDVLELFRIGPLGPGFADKSHLAIAALQPDLWVDPRGERFCDEGIAFYDTSVGNVNARYKEGYTWSILDDSIKNRMLTHGIVRNLSIDYMPGTKPVNFDRDIKVALERGSADVFAAQSLANLAEMMKVNPAVLKATVEKYNGYCAKGYDDMFAKDPRFLRPLAGPVYYAIKARTVFLGTKGGIKINERMEVVDKKGNIIPGLYAGGFDAGGAWGDSYPIMHCSGASSAFAINSGRIAGKNVLKYLEAFN